MTPKHYTYEEFLAANNITDEKRYGKCLRCNGNGVQRHECGYIHDCEECDGTGEIDIMRPTYDALCKRQERLLIDWNKAAQVNTCS